jgi:hypothetical protein
MGFSKTQFVYFKDECIKRFGKDEGMRIFLLADEKLERMMGDIQPETSSIIRNHMTGNMLPTIAMYLVLKDNCQTSQIAYDITLEIVQIAANKTKKKNSQLKKMPFAYQIFKLFCKQVMVKQYPKEGWDVVWRRYDKQEIHFDMTSCIYLDTTVKYHCPEVCTVFCANDDTTFAGYHPKIVFERSSTLAKGQDRCDFHFINGKTDKQDHFRTS